MIKPPYVSVQSGELVGCPRSLRGAGDAKPDFQREVGTTCWKRCTVKPWGYPSEVVLSGSLTARASKKTRERRKIVADADLGSQIAALEQIGFVRPAYPDRDINSSRRLNREFGLSDPQRTRSSDELLCSVRQRNVCAWGHRSRGNIQNRRVRLVLPVPGQ